MALTSECKTRIQKTEQEKILHNVDEFLARLEKPMNFRPYDPNGAPIALENSYNQLCASLESNGSVTVGLTVMQLYSRLNYYKELNEKMEAKK